MNKTILDHFRAKLAQYRATLAHFIAQNTVYIEHNQGIGRRLYTEAIKGTLTVIMIVSLWAIFFAIRVY